MLDLTGDNLTTYILRELKDIVNRNPRFRNMGGDVFVQTSSFVSWGDLQVQVGNISASGNRLSPDNFMCTQHGHAILAKLEHKDGVFVDWVKELRNQTDTSNNLTYPIPGVYYLNVDSVDEGTREVGLTLDTFRWVNGTIGPAAGSAIYFDPSIDVESVTPTDTTIQFVRSGSVIYITSYTTQQPLLLQTPAGPLTPNVDFWYLRSASVVVAESTTLGYQDYDLPTSDYVSLQITDQDGFVLRENTEFRFMSTDRIRLGQWTPSGYTLTATYTYKANPTTTPVIHEENRLPFSVGPDESLATGQVFLRSTFGPVYTEQDLVVRGDGTVWSRNLLRVGEKSLWEARVAVGQTTTVAKKLAGNQNIIPGLMIGIGDLVNVDDQCVILVSPDNTETYEVYGSKENISFDIFIKANDRMTASDIASAIRSYLQVGSRNEFEANGLTIFEVTKNSSNDQKGASGISPTTTYTLGVSAAADWEFYVPLTTRIGALEIDVEGQAPGWSLPGNPSILPRLAAFGQSQFIPSYT